MSEHPIEGLMTTAMNSIQNMIDVNTIIGDPIETSNNIIIIPISKVSFGFAAGGSEFKVEAMNEYSRRNEEEQAQYKLPFGGGSGAGVNINPIAFVVVQPDNVRLLPVTHTSPIDKLLDYMPDAIEKVNSLINKQMQMKKEEKQNKENQKEENRKEDVIIKDIKQPKTETQARTKTRRGRPRNNDTYEFEYNEVLNDEDMMNDDLTDDFDD